MKYIIELEPIEGTDLYRAKGANTLVFDKNGIKNILTPYKTKKVRRWETYDGDLNRAWSDYAAKVKDFVVNQRLFVNWLMEETEDEE